MKTREEVTKSLEAIVNQSANINARFLKSFDGDPAGAIKWQADDVWVYAKAAEDASRILHHAPTVLHAEWNDYCTSRGQYFLELCGRVQVSHQNTESLRDHAAWRMLWNAFTDHLI